VPSKSKHKRVNEPTSFKGLTQKPHCVVCALEANHPTPPFPQRPEPMPPTNQRPCASDTSMHFCPHVGCDYQGG